MKYQYVFGESTWNTISRGILHHDPVEAEITYELQRILKVNIKSCSHCVFEGIKSSSIQIFFESDEDKEHLLEIGGKIERESFGAIVFDKRNNKKILKTVDSILQKRGIHQVPGNRVVRADNFDQTVVSCFFEEKIDEIFYFCKSDFPNIDFALNFNMSRDIPGYYCILFMNAKDHERFTKNGFVDSLIKRVNGYCINKIPFSSFEHIRVIPFVGSLDSLASDYMGLVENNRKNPLRNGWMGM